MRYVLYPGWVTSKNDGDQHFIGGPRIARLYGVDIRECVFGDMNDYKEQDGDVHLRPNYNGDYTLPPAGRKEGAVLTGTEAEDIIADRKIDHTKLER